ncbi:hypothetical protein C2S53_017155 [Perilla frutescens var. hirtella]|uniref:EF-hand domain-containing protein n=1 Tax=Perilla frutescens var. hirtella TaxID=608512 RepID=A0AAD4J6L9_PERFH|nr:hypothetical protein C2S53_017155 [Perilla frutescens var. hirtella]
MADGIRRIARAYYERASEEEKNEAKQYFSELDKNGDGKIKVTELKSRYSGTLVDNYFKKLDSDGDGVLGFSDVLVLFYIKKDKVGVGIVCDGCDELTFGDPYFSCVLCLPKHPQTYDLCCDCYGRGKLEHCHPLTNFMHNQNHHGRMLKQHQEKTTQATGEMEELRKIATMIYKSASADVKASAHDFFRFMDKDGDQRVNISEFLSSMSQQGHEQLQTRRMFQELDRDGDGALDFSEVVTLYYIIKSCRPTCNWCKDFIPGIFFSCVLCFKVGRSYDLCRSCYLSNDANHSHNGATQFLDNFAFLQNIREYLIEARYQQGNELSQSQAIVPRTGKSKIDVAATIVNTICQITNAVCSVVSIAGKCTIM